MQYKAISPVKVVNIRAAGNQRRGDDELDHRPLPMVETGTVFEVDKIQTRGLATFGIKGSLHYLLISNGVVFALPVSVEVVPSPVTRAEFEELRARVDALAAILVK